MSPSEFKAFDEWWQSAGWAGKSLNATEAFVSAKIAAELATRRALVAAAKTARAEAKYAALPDDRWDIGYRRACEVIAAQLSYAAGP